MKLSRRTILQGAGALPFAVASLRMGALAQPAPSSEVPPILFVHGNGDYDALWMTTLWRMESNGIARDRIMVIAAAASLHRNTSGYACSSGVDAPMPTSARLWWRPSDHGKRPSPLT